MTPIVGYCIGSHVAQNHIATPILVDSMMQCLISPSRIVVVVNGSYAPHDMVCRGVRYLFRQQEDIHHLHYVVSENLGGKLGITHWFYLNCTSRCGLKFKELVESGFNPEDDAVCATNYILAIRGKGSDGRPINDLAMYRDDFLLSIGGELSEMRCSGEHAIFDHEGLAWALAKKKSKYPNLSYLSTGPTDVYGTGTMRKTEYHGAIDWYRYKKNWGQMMPPYDASKL